MATVTLEKINKVYPNGFHAIHDLDLEIADTEFLVLVGPSGCGKSTALRMIAGLEEISGGEMLIGDNVVNDVEPKDRDIAMVFQNYALYPHMTVRDNIGFALKLAKTPKAEIDARVEEAARILELTEQLGKRPGQLSGGQRQRVAMGRAIVRQPSAFLMDEPLSNLDAKLRVQMRVELSRLHQRLQTTMVYVTHDQVEAMTLADRIVVMKDGIIQQAGPPMELFHKPENAFVGGFIGSPSMNFITGEVKRQGDVAHVVAEHFDIALNAELTQTLTDQDVAEVMVGVRPQDLNPSLDSDASLTSTIDVIEPMGAESYYYFNVGDQQLVGRSEGDAVAQVGQETRFGLNLEHLHLFSTDGQRRLN